MVANPVIRNLMRENKLAQIPSIMQTSKTLWMQTTKAIYQELLAKNFVTKDKLAFYLPNQR